MTELPGVSTQTSRDDTIERRVNGRAGAPPCRGQDRRSRGAHSATGRSGRDMHPWLSVMQGYWNGAEQTAEAIDRGALDAQWRSRHDGCGRLHRDHRPQQGHGDPRRREHLSVRGGGVPLRPSGRSRCAGVRRARCILWRGAVRLDQAEVRRDGDRGRHQGILPRAASRTSRSRATCGSWTAIR